MVFEIGPDPLLTCPLDESHRILRSRLQFHLVRCLKNNKLGMRLKCPWNPLHIIDKFAYENHYKYDCEDLPKAMESIYTTEKSEDVGSVPVTATNGLVLPVGEEDWDAGPVTVGTYDPKKNAEEKLVLRIAVGLSKAKKKAYRQAERKRFQEIEARGPIQTNNSQRSEKPGSTKELRTPLTISKNLSTNVSMIEDLNSTKHSEIDKNVRESAPLRAPRKPSLTLSYKPEVLTKKNGVGRRSITSEDGARALDEVPKLCQSFGNPFHDSSTGIPNLNDSLAYFSDAEKSLYFDKSNCVPNLVGPGARPENDNVLELSQRFAELTTMKKKIDNAAAFTIEQMEMYRSELPKLVNSTVSLNVLDKTHDDGNTGDNISLTEQQSLLMNGLGKCAANFPKHSRTAPPRIGRGMVMAIDSFKENRPGLNPELIDVGINNIQRCPGRVSTNPFEISEDTFAANSSRKSYTLSAANADDDDSEYGYEKVD